MTDASYQKQIEAKTYTPMNNQLPTLVEKSWQTTIIERDGQVLVVTFPED